MQFNKVYNKAGTSGQQYLYGTVGSVHFAIVLVCSGVADPGMFWSYD